MRAIDATVTNDRTLAVTPSKLGFQIGNFRRGSLVHIKDLRGSFIVRRLQ